ncbi:MAG: DUF4091 domain-containing protein [Acidobacteria bacterium]|nr:DUF4091 domain-containing protein [Acidobacteriota bacterium]
MKLGVLALAAAAVCAGADLTVLPGHVRVDPFGQITAADRGAGVAPARSMVVESARAAHVSCRLVVTSAAAAAYTLSVSGGVEAELFREWFHFLPKSKAYIVDALIPVALPAAAQLPAADNKVAGQTAQSYWLDLWVPANARAGAEKVTVVLEAGGQKSAVTVEVRVLDARVPDKDAVVMDHNAYGTSWFGGQYPGLAKKPGFYLSDDFFGLIHAYHRVYYEHRGVFHQLGYGHGGKVGEEFAPRLEGAGKNRHVADWTYYDKHYGPLFDGSAFAKTRRGAQPIPYVYTPINPEWPASYLWWGEPGYEREFVNVVGEMEAHFRAKGWTKTKLELFFNHKKRYKAFEWDGDETRFPKDFERFREYQRLMKAAMPAGSPVEWVYRTDASWQMERQFKELAGVINFWVCGGGMFGWYLEEGLERKKQGDTVWIYGGTPPVARPSSHVTKELLETWMLGVDGFVRWLTVAPGADPWFQFQGGGETLVYPGERFGISGPLASVRLKLERNALEDLALLETYSASKGAAALRAEVARRYNGTEVKDWHAPRPRLADGDPSEWTNADIGEAMPKDARFDEKLDAGAWARVRAYVMELAKEGRR